MVLSCSWGDMKNHWKDRRPFCLNLQCAHAPTCQHCACFSHPWQHTLKNLLYSKAVETVSCLSSCLRRGYPTSVNGLLSLENMNMLKSAEDNSLTQRYRSKVNHIALSQSLVMFVHYCNKTKLIPCLVLCFQVFVLWYHTIPFIVSQTIIMSFTWIFRAPRCLAFILFPFWH